MGVFQNRGVCGQAFPSFPSPNPLPRPFCSRPDFRASRTRKLLDLAAQYFVRLLRERLLRRQAHSGIFRGSLLRRQEETASCRLCRKGLQEQFVAKSDGAEYVCRSSRACSYFCSLDALASYERVQFRGGDAPLYQHQRACALRVSHSVKNVGRPYFTCRERWPSTFSCWADLEVTLRPLPSQRPFKEEEEAGQGREIRIAVQEKKLWLCLL